MWFFYSLNINKGIFESNYCQTTNRNILFLWHSLKILTKVLNVNTFLNQTINGELFIPFTLFKNIFEFTRNPTPNTTWVFYFQDLTS